MQRSWTLSWITILRHHRTIVSAAFAQSFEAKSLAECSCQIVRCCLTFAYCIGASGGAGNLASYLAGQRGRNLRFFTEHIHTPGYFGLRSFLKTGNLFGLQYIYGTLTNSTGKDPLDFPTLKNNPSEYEIVVTNALTGKAEYFGKETMAQDDYRLIMASSAIPAAHTRRSYP